MIGFIDWLWSTSLALAVLIPLAWALSRVLRRFSGARAAYLAWVLPLAALVPTQLFSGLWASMPVMEVSPNTLALAPAVETASPSQISAMSVGLFAIWGLGVLLLTIYFGLGHARFHAQLRRKEQWPEKALTGPVSRLPVWLPVRYSAACQGPMVVGVCPPTLWLPADFHQAPQHEQEMMLAHEQAHLRHGDPLWLFTALLLTCLFWFHPLIHVAWYRFRADQELAADAAVIAVQSRTNRRGYAETLCRTAGLRAHVLGLGGLRPSMLKERVHMIADQRSRPMPFGGSAILVAVMFLASGWVIAGGAEPPRVSDLEPVETPAPEWPRKAMTEGITGHVSMELEINEEGYVTDVEVVDAEPEEVFDKAAYRAVRQWRFPEQDEPVIAEQTIRFELEEDENAE